MQRPIRTGAGCWAAAGIKSNGSWGRFPVAAELDAAIADRPALLSRVDGHAEWLNSAALRAAGITKTTPDPEGGRIERDGAGNPTGVLVDKAMDLADKAVPPYTPAERRAALREALARMNAVGLTSVGDAGDTAADIELFKAFGDEHLLTVRIYAMIRDIGDDFRSLSPAGPILGYADDRLTVRAVKLFADGALGSRGAALLAPYSDQPAQHGLLFMSDRDMERDIETALRAGYQVNVHAIGDAANRQVLNGFEAAYKSVDGRYLRNRIEHAQVVALSDIPRFKQLDLIASMQPTHATSDMNMAQDRIGEERLKGAYAWRRFLDQGTRIAGGSDFPVESPNPFFRATRGGHPHRSFERATRRVAARTSHDPARSLPRVHAGCGICRASGKETGLARGSEMGRLHPGRPRPVQHRSARHLESSGTADLGWRRAGQIVLMDMNFVCQVSDFYHN